MPTLDLLHNRRERPKDEAGRHLKACKNCQRFIATYRKTAALGKVFEKPRLDPEFKESLFEFLVQKAGGKA